MKNTDNVKIDREILKKNLKKILINNIPNKSLIDEVKSDMLALGISHGTTQDIFNQRITTEQLSEDVLYYLSRSLFFKLKEGALINPDSYFTINEIEEIKLQKATKLSHEDKKIPYVIRDVISVARDHKVVFMKARDLVELYNSGLIRYRMETQRQPTIKKSRFDGTLIKVPTLNDRSVVEIKNELVRGTFLLNYITLNSIKQDSFNYDEVTGELEVLGILDIADGHHRSMAMVMALSEGDIDYVTGVNITNWDNYNLTSNCKFRDGRIIFKFNEDMMKYLLQLQQHYFLQSPMVITFGSWYSMRLYDMFKAHSYKKEPFEIALDDLKEILDLKGKYERFNNFRDRIIDVSLNEINEKSDITVTFERKTKGRKVIGLMFEIKSKLSELDSLNNIVEMREGAKLKDSNFSDHQVLKLYEATVDRFTSYRNAEDIYTYMVINYNYTKKIKKDGNIYGYCKNCLENDHAKAIPQILNGYIIDDVV